MPTSSDIDHMDAASAERSAHQLGIVMPDSAVVWSVNGQVTTEAAAKKISADSIATVNIGKFEGRSYMFIVTRGNQRLAPPARVDSVRVIRPDGRRENMMVFRNPSDAKSSEGQPMLLVDGVRSDPSVLKTLDRNRIERVDVLKGEAATRAYGADGSNGVIVITTKSR